METNPQVEGPGAGVRDPDLFTILAIAFELSLIPGAWFLAWLWQGEPIPGARLDGWAAGLAVAATVPPLVGLAAITWTPLRKLGPIRRIRERIREVLGSTVAQLQLWQIAAISIAAGVGEEVLFRGAFQARAGLVVASILFGLVHWITPTYAILAALLGFYLGWLLEALNHNLLGPIIVHALYDLIALVVVRRELRKEGFPKDLQESGPPGE